MRVRVVVAVLSLITGVSVLIGSPAAAAVVINVASSQPTIQAGIDASSAGDTVAVAPGTYAERIDFKGKAIEVHSVAGPATTTINGGGLPNVVTFKTGETRASVLRGFTVTNGALGIGGSAGIGIHIANASPTVVDNVITGNSAPVGSGAGIRGRGERGAGNAARAVVDDLSAGHRQRRRPAL